jgi:SagB-type dehydrogenase family enzyme
MRYIGEMTDEPGTEIETLPAPETAGTLSLEAALTRRACERRYCGASLSRPTLGQLLWAGQGRSDSGRRTCPSAGATYPLELYVVEPDGLGLYEPDGHRLRRRQQEDPRQALAAASLGQSAVAHAGAVIVIAADRSRTAQRYGERAERYVMMEAGHCAQNLLLQATALGLGAVPIGAFEDQRVDRLLGLPARQQAIYLVAVGHV